MITKIISKVTSPDVNVDELIEGVQTGAISWDHIHSLLHSKKLSTVDYGRIMMSVEDMPCTCRLPATSIIASMEYQKKNKLTRKQI